MANTCIRVYANLEQIEQCKKDVQNVNSSVTRIARALSLAGNEVRLKILFLLNQESKMCPCDLSDILGMTVPAISQHLRKLKDARLVRTNKVGQTIFYSIIESNDLILNQIFGLIETEKSTVS
ncbi:MAG: DNA-binding transcriptional ArsR family regulator [Parvicella sp.]|jgi:DNA-binding transcriptional ArsR family regulator